MCSADTGGHADFLNAILAGYARTATARASLRPTTPLTKSVHFSAHVCGCDSSARGDSRRETRMIRGRSVKTGPCEGDPERCP